MTTTAKLAVATSILSLLLGMLIGQQATKEKYSAQVQERIEQLEEQKFEVPSYVIYTPKETKLKVDIRNTLMATYDLDITKADWLADNIVIANQIYGIPFDIMISLISVESEFDEFAKSGSNAVGFTQVVPSVWRDDIPYDVYKPAENILAGAHILNVYKTECGNWECALKAYNIGITNFKAGKEQSAAKRYVKKIKIELTRLMAFNSTYSNNLKRG